MLLRALAPSQRRPQQEDSSAQRLGIRSQGVGRARGRDGLLPSVAFIGITPLLSLRKSLVVCEHHSEPFDAILTKTDTVHAPPETSRENEQYASVASISEERKAQARSQPPQTLSTPTSADTVKTAEDGNTTATGSPEALEEEAGQQGAFNEETGEINWDCPCLGGMAYGPCGEQFRAAFSCFVFSKEEPKGVDCIENFKTMQNCFREHPDVYGGELDEDEEPPPHQDDEQGQAVSVARDPAPQTTAAETQVAQKESAAVSSATSSGREDEKERVRAATNQVKEQNSGLSESDAIVPKAWHDGKE